MAEMLACTRTWPRTPSAYSDSSPCILSRLNSTERAWCNRLWPAGVGVTPRAWRISKAVPTVASRSDNRLLTAEGAMNSVSAALPMLPRSHTATKSCSVVRSRRRVKARSGVFMGKSSRFKMTLPIFP